MTTTAAPMQATPGTPLVRMCLELIAREESQLHSSLRALEQFRQLLTTNGPEHRMQAVEQCKQAAGLLEEVRQQRDHFRQEAARILEAAPDSLTLRAVAGHLPAAEAAIVMQGRQRLRELAEEIDRVNRGNALIVWWCLDFVHQVFAAIRGNPIGGRYSAVGKAQKDACGPIWQAQG